ncbi:hypothetical protein [Endozoicomonas sp. ISHI1]|uniref:hypothetical protein n=1 Tax=Endozoicomonas sp. ISHI1 TaxID=2825882 RepID=UPI0021499906|nr:hypothetical protein [Endozoicomonas sp. ISHI1]
MSTESVRHVYFPYCPEQQDDGSWVLLNRNYKPVGFNTTEFVSYEDHPVSINLKGLGQATLEKLSYNGEVNGKQVFLYNDGCIPTDNPESMKAYLTKLERLVKLKHRA